MRSDHPEPLTGSPHVTVYNEISLDGKINGFVGNGVRYYRRGFRWVSDAILMGSVTAQAFGPDEHPEDQVRTLPSLPPVALPAGFGQLVREPRPMLVVPDSGGRLRNWRHARAQPWYGRIVVLVSGRTPPDYLDYLDRRGIEHLRRGETRVDLKAALLALAHRHGIRSVRTDAGGSLNGALLAAGLVHRIAVIIAPHLARDPQARGLIQLPLHSPAIPLTTALTLAESEVLDDGALWLVYEVRHPA